MTIGETVYFQALTSCHEPAGSFIHTYIYIYIYMLPFKSMGLVSVFFQGINTFIQQGCIKLIKSDSKVIFYLIIKNIYIYIYIYII